MLPRLQAREALRATTIGAVAAGRMKRNESQRIQRDWRRQASAGDSGGAGRRIDLTRMTRMQRALTLKSMGIDLVEVPRQEQPQ